MLQPLQHEIVSLTEPEKRRYRLPHPLSAMLCKGWKEVYEKNYTKSLDHRSFYFKQGDKKNFSGKQMVLELKSLVEDNGGGEGEGGGSSTQQQQQQQQQQ